MLGVSGSIGVIALSSVSVRNLSSMVSIEAFASFDPVSRMSSCLKGVFTTVISAAVRREHVVDEGIFGALDGIAVAEDHDRQLDHAGVGPHLLVPPNSNVHRDRPVIAIRIVESETLVANSPFADAEITDGDQRTDR